MRENREPTSCLVVGNYCHDVLMKDGVVLAESLGGAASFISAVLDGVSISSTLITKWVLISPTQSPTRHSFPLIPRQPSSTPISLLKSSATIASSNGCTPVNRSPPLISPTRGGSSSAWGLA
ncbi:UNVERIFIED_CONTAM: Inositol 3-kinase [Sesamum latifolium]|uniref:Inositol 3-kinase n=1 Tax=Sesamum latifolium TaxID=2727402 RepID=A0AAW2XWF5_9LAMI